MPTKRLPDDRLAAIITETGHMAFDAPYAAKSSAIYDMALELQEYRAATGYCIDPEKVLPERNQPAVAELAERLAKVEDRLSQTYSQLMALSGKAGSTEAELHTRIDKVVEIIGERISGLIDRLDKLEKPWAYPPTEVIDAAFAALPPDAHGTIAPGEMERVLQAAARAAFPTGGASTAEAAADAVLPVPQRGDRVRLEGAVSVGHTLLANGWYEVLGQEARSFQVRFSPNGVQNYDIVGVDLFWVENNSPGLKEVKSNGNT